MFSKSLPKTLKSSSFRLALWHWSFFILSSILILTATYYFLSTELKSTDRQAILSELNELSSTYNHFGMDVFQNEVTENIKYRKKNPFFVRIADWANRTLIMIPLILIGFAGGAYLSNRTLRPIRDIIQTVQSIETEDMEARVPRSGTE